MKRTIILVTAICATVAVLWAADINRIIPSTLFTRDLMTSADAAAARVKLAAAASSGGSFTNATFTGQSTFAVGSAGLPSIVFSGEPSAGIYSSVPDQIDFATGATLRWSIDSSGTLLHADGLEIRSDGANGVYIGEGSGNPGNTPVITTAVGTSALGSVTSGLGNTAVGASVMSALTTGIRNTGAGANTLTDTIFNATGTSAFGYQVMGALETGNNNSAFGYLSGANLTTGGNNVIIGQGSGGTLTTGSNNIYIGYNVDAAGAGDANTLTIGNLVFGVGVDGEGTTISTGKIGIGTRGPDARLDVLAAPGPQLRLTYTDGTIYTDFDTDSSGIMSISPSGGEIDLNGHVFVESGLDVDGVAGFDAPVLTLMASTGGGNTNLFEQTMMFRGTTTDSSATAIGAVSLSNEYTTLIEVSVTARRTSGAAGAANDGAAYVRRAAANGGTALIGSVQDAYTAEDQAGWDVTLTHTTDDPDYFSIDVTGAADNNVSWHAVVKLTRVGS